MRVRLIVVCLWMIEIAAPGLPAPSAGPDQNSWTATFPEEKSDLVSTGVNPYFNLTPGYVLVLEGEEDGQKARLVITVLDETKAVDGVETRIVEERETVGGELVEVSRNYYAISKKTNSVYYFGEDSRGYKDGKESSRAGSWEAGVGGARYGLMIPGTPLLGGRYYQEVAPGTAMDRAEIVSLSDTLKVPAGAFEKVLKTEETTPSEPGSLEFKYYASGVGLLKDGDLVLVRHGIGAAPEGTEPPPEKKAPTRK